MKAIVTGANGFIGGNLYNKLNSQNYTVYGIDPNLDNSYISGRSTTQKLLPKLLWNPDVIFHLGAHIDVTTSFKNPNEYFDNNINSTLAVLEFARKNKCKVIYAGSASKHINPYTSLPLNKLILLTKNNYSRSNV
jgi:UDP-glucose 4-epimerase